jgi:hypothetical protein
VSDPSQPPEPEPEPQGTIRTTSPTMLLGIGLVTLVLGWALRPATIRWLGTAPRVTWLQVLALVLVAAILAVVARSTYRTIHVRRQTLEPYQAVNRLVLAKACAIAGAAVAGGYLGYALAWVGIDEQELAGERLLRSALAGVAGVTIVLASLALERACRVRRDED